MWSSPLKVHLAHLHEQEKTVTTSVSHRMDLLSIQQGLQKGNMYTPWLTTSLIELTVYVLKEKTLRKLFFLVHISGILFWLSYIIYDCREISVYTHHFSWIFDNHIQNGELMYMAWILRPLKHLLRCWLPTCSTYNYLDIQFNGYLTCCSKLAPNELSPESGQTLSGNITLTTKGVSMVSEIPLLSEEFSDDFPCCWTDVHAWPIVLRTKKLPSTL